MAAKPIWLVCWPEAKRGGCLSDDLALIERARQGDKAALAEIVETHQHTVYNVALRMCGNPHDAEDTLQETFLNALQAMPKFAGRSQLSTWLYRIASNVCLMQRRREAMTPDFLSMDDPLGASEESADDFRLDQSFMVRAGVDWTVKPEEVLLDNELREVMEEAITRVPPALRIVFIWRDLEGMSTAETAEILGISEGTVKVRLHRARLHLRQALAAYFLERRSGGEGPSNQERSQKELSKEETT